MVKAGPLLRSLTSEPDDDDANVLRPVSLTESPFISSPPAQAPPSIWLADDPGVSKLSLAPAPIDTVNHLASYGPLVDKENESSAGVSPHAQAERERRRPPEWLVSGILFDLAWTTTFSSLTNNTPITDIGTVLSYAVFFTLAWWLWAAQVSYDAKFYTNDYYHRLMLLAQLGLFGCMAAFTKDFNPFSTHVNPKLSKIVDFRKDEYTRASMLGISALFAVSRLLLVISYSRVRLYARKSVGMRKQYRALHIQIATYFISSVLYGIAALIVEFDLEASSVAGRLTIWALATVIEVVSFLWTPDIPAQLLINDDYISVMGVRVRTLTTIILGEGLNSIVGVLVLAASAIGFGAYAGGTTAATSVVIAFGFLLYFDGWRPGERAGTKTKLDFLLHFPLHLAVIVLLDALKNALAISSLSSTLTQFIKRGSTPEKGETEQQALIAAFKHLGIDLIATLNSEIQETDRTWPSLSDDNVVLVSTNKVIAKVYLSTLEQYQLADDVQDEFANYMTSDTGALVDSYASDTFQPWIWTYGVLKDQLEPAVWIPIAAGVFLGSMAILAIVNAWLPKHRYIWASALTRLFMAVGVSLFALLKLDPDVWYTVSGEQAAVGDSFLVPVLPLLVMGAFVTQYALDQLIFFIASRRHARRQRSRAV